MFLFLICRRNGLCEDHNDKSHGFSRFLFDPGSSFQCDCLGIRPHAGHWGWSCALGLADKLDLVQMMLDCAETMTSVLDNVTDMGINLNILLSLFSLKSL